ncbi:MAG: histidine phosphatase family protein [Bacteroidota bacterium]
MKTLILIRHAMPEDGFGLPDFERNLTTDGKSDATKIGESWKSEGFCPDFILSSAAVRAKQTAELIAEACAYPKSVVLEKQLYSTYEMALLDRIHALDDAHQRVVLVNHNPAISGLVEMLTNDYIPMRQGTQIEVSFAADKWSEIEEGKGKILKTTHAI